MGAGYGRMSFGAEYSLYRAGRDGFTREFDMYFPWFGVNFDVGGSLRAGLEAALGFGSGDRLNTTEHPVLLRGRGSMLFIQRAFGVGPFVGYAHNFGAGVQGEDPIPFGFELGGSLSIWVR